MCLCVILIINSLQAFCQITEGEKEILELQDKRMPGENDKLVLYAHSTDSLLRIKAINALANIGDSSYIDKINYMLGGPYKNYPNEEDLRYFAFMLGQIPSQKSIEVLELMLQENYGSSNTVKSYVIEALGKAGDQESLEKIISGKYTGDILLDRAAAMSIGRMAIRNIKDERAVSYLKNLLRNSTDTLTNRNIAFAFWRIGDKNLLGEAKEEIYLLAENEDPQTRMWAYNALGKLRENLLLMYTLENFNSEKDWRVKVNMLNSLTNYRLDSLEELTGQILSVLGDGIGSDNEHVSLTALSVLGKMFADLKDSKNNTARSNSVNLKEEFRSGLDSSLKLSWRIKSELANSMSLIFRDESKPELFKAFANTNDYNVKAGILRAFGNFKDGMIYKEVRDTVSAEVQRYNAANPNESGNMIGSEDLAILYRGFIDMLSSLDEKVDEENRNTMRLMFTEFVSSKDPYIVNSSLTALTDSIYSKNRPETVSVMKFDYNELEYPKDMDVMLGFIDALGELRDSSAVELLSQNLMSSNYQIAKASADALEKITWRKHPVHSVPWNDFDWNYMSALNQKKNIIIKTNKGEIKINLLPDAAPFTVMNFLKLSERNYFDGIIFHRVVPNFVIQGGDPTGTGYGGPGYMIRSEFSPLEYQTGMVGMASSGKDTEGSQFFITHSATPHLDGRYTIFGKVTRGMDVVNSIMAGDYIEDVIIE